MPGGLKRSVFYVIAVGIWCAQEGHGEGDPSGPMQRLAVHLLMDGWNGAVP